MSMLIHFFDVDSDRTIFDGLEISGEKELSEEYMGKFPVISITLKGATGENFEEAKVMLRRIIGREAMRFRFLLESDWIDGTERSQYEALISMDKTGTFTMSDDLLKDSLLMLSQFLQKHYGQGTVIPIDKYDVPIDKTYRAKFKTNDSLKFAVLTGCLRISKESNVSANAETSEKLPRCFSRTSPWGDVLFTGLNNFKVYTVMTT